MPRDDNTILIVDDHSLSRKLLTIQLTNFGFSADKILECHGSHEALEKLERNNFDIAIVDWDMPDMSGLELFEHCKASQINTAFVMVSAEAQPERILHAISSGIASYITKPVSQSDINEKMTKVLEWMAARTQ